MAEEEGTVKCLTAKEIKMLAKPEFAANPEKFYPTETFKKLGFTRAQCPVCANNYWRCSEKRTTCGDSNCDGKYSFIGNGFNKDGKKITFAEAWKGFEKSFTTARIPCESIKRYPIVARWRNDVDFVAAGIFCFQPYCVTGELEPPANPLICPQFCARFNDLDNIGITGRHYSGFIMLGIQVFNYPDKYVFFKEEVIEFNYRWLTETLNIPPEEITFIEDVWAGGGNLGPSVEYFVRGLEVGNMVFMQYKTFHDGSREELKIKVIDVGIGLERVAWLANGSATSYEDTFFEAMKYCLDELKMEINRDVWEKFGPYSCTLNIDEVDDIDKAW
jgi:alanyl-tRNA synthetase